MIWFVISIILLLFSSAVTCVAMSRDVKGAGIGLIPGLVGLLLLIPACLYSVDVGEVAVIRNMGGSLVGHSEDAGFHWKTPWQSVIKYDTRNNLINFYKDTDYKYDGGSAVGKQVAVNDRSGASADIDVLTNQLGPHLHPDWLRQLTNHRKLDLSTYRISDLALDHNPYQNHAGTHRVQDCIRRDRNDYANYLDIMRAGIQGARS